ncbi:transketolase [Marinilactibacillus piezotolerans]|uniref:Transketolase n=1 Tax=Marinilactibacillus piezotolerans TaxID=258723 RepID=A0A1I4AI36_9LACT|nr:transketolase [Marinilactibacillus piezotolerans]SFK55591.1 transketolase [Marinilactibacillus piezotolerans]
MFDKIDELGVNTLRTLSIDAVQKANSGHPGLPMGAAPMAYTLWTRHLKVNPKNSKWFDRDRFILSAGHGSALLYSLLHLSGYDVSIDDVKNFRQLGSKTPGHPEVHITDGVEATTGPLGQGIANAVGFAMAEAHLGAIYNKESHNIVDHYTYALCGDGDLQEGVSQEAASLAGHLKLGKLIVLYDSNDIQLDGPIEKAFTENVGKRFEAYNWEHIRVEDGNDLESINKAIEQAKENKDQPTLIEVKTVIGYGAENAGTSAVHGAPLGAESITATKKAYLWEGEDFYVPESVQQRFSERMIEKGQQFEEDWNKRIDSYKAKHTELAASFTDMMDGSLPENWQENLPVYLEQDGAKATRASSGEVLNAIAKAVPNFWGGSADLSGSNKTMISNQNDFSADQYDGRNIWYGVREFAMAAALNGILLHGGTKSYVSTFFVFSDYLRPAVRLAALSEIPAIYVMTHDSIAVGEDGPTHEPVEQLSSYRGMHNLSVIRPADGNEVAAAWEIAVESTKTPTMLVLTRQDLPVLPNTNKLARESVKKGAYVISPSESEKPTGILIATGSEVSLAIEAQKQLNANGEDVSVVSMPSMDLFEKQSNDYKESVLPAIVTKRVAIEMGSSFGWDRYTGMKGAKVTIDKFGQSGEGNAIVEAYGFTVQNIVKTYNELS